MKEGEGFWVKSTVYTIKCSYFPPEIQNFLLSCRKVVNIAGGEEAFCVKSQFPTQKSSLFPPKLKTYKSQDKNCDDWLDELFKKSESKSINY